jgi:hypothetical protein
VEENYFEIYPERKGQQTPTKGFLGSNSGISPFLEEMRALLGLENIRIGGAANKALMLLEGRGSCYILDTGGTSRWDTCASEAVLRAGGGKFWKLTDFMKSPRSDEKGYTYLKAILNTNYESNASRTKGNSLNINEEIDRPPQLEDFKSYSNLCGHLALAPGEDPDEYWGASQRAQERAPPQYA